MRPHEPAPGTEVGRSTGSPTTPSGPRPPQHTSTQLGVLRSDPEQAERLHKFAHDLRNRLIGLQQSIERLREGPPPEEREEFAEFGERQFFKALREVETLMDDLGVVRGTVAPAFEACDLAELVRRHVDLMGYRIERKGQRVQLDLQGLPKVSGDPRILGDLIDALLSNASKFSDSGTVIEIRGSKDGQQVRLDVCDHGTGLSPTDLEQVFVRFAWLANKPTGGESQGRGSLARARSWAEAHHGTLEAASAGVGHGCCFTLRLPVHP